MHELKDLLPARPEEPPQIVAIKSYVKKHFKSICSVKITNDCYIVAVENGSVATLLRMSMPAVMEECDLDKKIAIRIGL